MAKKSPFRLFDISEDVLWLIFRHNVSLQDLKSLRLTHSGFHGSVNPLLFQNIKVAAPIYLDTVPRYVFPGITREIWSFGVVTFPQSKDPDPETSAYQISAILQRHVPLFLSDNAQSVVIKRYDIFEGYPDVKSMTESFPQYSTEGINCLEHFLCNLRKLQSLEWHIPSSNITQLIDLSPIAANLNIFQLLSTSYRNNPAPELSYKAFNVFKSLTSLNLSLYNPGGVTDLNNFPHLKTLKFNIQNTVYQLSEDVDKAVRPQNFDFVDFLTAQTVPFRLHNLSLGGHCISTPIPDQLVCNFLRELKTLHLYNLTPEVNKYHIIDALKRGEIKLRHLDVRGCHPDLIDYLTSYNNTLQSLKVSVECLKDQEGLTEEEDVWAYTGARRRWHEELVDLKKKDFKLNIWKLVIPAHTVSLEHLTFGENCDLYLNSAEILSQCKALKTINIKGDDPVLHSLVPVAAKLPLLESVEFQIPWLLRKPSMVGWCGTAQLNWYSKPKDIESRVKGMKWREEDINSDWAWENTTFTVAGLLTDLKLVRRRDKFYPWILAGDGEMGIEGREGDAETDEDGDYEDGNEDYEDEDEEDAEDVQN